MSKSFNNNKRIKLCAVTTRSLTMKRFLIDTLNYFSKKDIDVTIICEYDEEIFNLISDGVCYIPINFKSGIVSPISIFLFIKKLKKIFKNNKFDIVQYASTNAGLYAAIAAKKAKVPIRIFNQWGMMYMGSKGIKRFIFKAIERYICKCSSCVQGDSVSIAKYAIEEKVLPPHKNEIVWNGSSTGVDVDIFSPCCCQKNKKTIRIKLGIDDNSIVFGYIGRINTDKGIREMLEAYNNVSSSAKKTYLVIVGPKEKDREINTMLDEKINKNRTIIYVGSTNNPIEYYSAFDFLILPSYREGLATVLLESMACGIPVLSSNILGSIDVVKDGVNGILFDKQSISSLEQALLKAININENEYKLLSSNARELMVKCFDHSILEKKIYQDRINKVQEQ